MIKNFFVFFTKACFHKAWTYRVFHKFRQAKFAYGGLVLGSSPFSLLPQLPASKNDVWFKSGQNRLEINHLNLLI